MHTCAHFLFYLTSIHFTLEFSIQRTNFAISKINSLASVIGNEKTETHCCCSWNERFSFFAGRIKLNTDGGERTWKAKKRIKNTRRRAVVYINYLLKDGKNAWWAEKNGENVRVKRIRSFLLDYQLWSKNEIDDFVRRDIFPEISIKM